jgi:hypothetical protein
LQLRAINFRILRLCSLLLFQKHQFAQKAERSEAGCFTAKVVNKLLIIPTTFDRLDIVVDSQEVQQINQVKLVYQVTNTRIKPAPGH